MKEANEEQAAVNTGTESKLAKKSRMIFGIVFAFAFLFLIFKMAMTKFG
jgi:hypothetical protein